MLSSTKTIPARGCCRLFALARLPNGTGAAFSLPATAVRPASRSQSTSNRDAGSGASAGSPDMPTDLGYKNRIELTNEIHKHRNVPLRAPLAASVLAVIKETSKAKELIDKKGASPMQGGSIVGETSIDEDHQMRTSGKDHIAALCELYGVPLPLPNSRKHFSTDIESLRFVFEDHEEFSTFSFFRMSSPGRMDAVQGDPTGDPFEEPPISLVPSHWISSMPGRVILALNIVVEQTPEDSEGMSVGDPESSVNMLRQQRLSKIFSHHNVMSCSLQSGQMKMKMFTDYRIQKDGYTRILCQTHATTEALHSTSGRWQMGRTIKHIVDMECYRLLALLALPLATRVKKPMQQLDSKLQELILELSSGREKEEVTFNHNEDHRVLGEIMALHAQAEQISSGIKPRFAAAEAYFSIVRDRIEQLSMQDFGRYTCCDKFIMQRLSPAMHTLRSTEARLELNMASLQRATNLLRTRVEITQEQQNAQVLKSMAQRADMQVKLQQTVEGLSAGPVTYYTLGVLGYGLQGLHSVGGLPCSVETALGAAMPVVLFAVYVGLRRLHKHLHGSTGGSH